jgi:uncharacterized protein YndB with AHSA1/START domain
MPEPDPQPNQPEGGLEIRWIFDAPRERVWREWITREAFADWFGGPQSPVPLDSVEWDLRPGGKWKLTMHAERGKIPWSGEFLEIEKPERLVFTITDQPEPELYARCTVVLTELDGGRTEMHFQQTGGLPPGAYKPAREGWKTFFRRVDERLAEPS